MNRDGAGRQLEIGSFAGQLVRPLPSDFYGRVCGRSLLDVADKLRKHGIDHRPRRLRSHSESAITSPFDVVRLAAVAEQKSGPVSLPHHLDEADQPCCLPNADYQDACC